MSPADPCSDAAADMGFCSRSSMALLSPASAAIHVKMHRVSGYQGKDCTRHFAAWMGLATCHGRPPLRTQRTREMQFSVDVSTKRMRAMGCPMRVKTAAVDLPIHGRGSKVPGPVSLETMRNHTYDRKSS
jgi:hypothetical protein